MPCCRLKTRSDLSRVRNRMREKEERSAGTRKVLKSCFQMIPSTSDSHCLDVWLREGEPFAKPHLV